MLTSGCQLVTGPGLISHDILPIPASDIILTTCPKHQVDAPPTLWFAISRSMEPSVSVFWVTLGHGDISEPVSVYGVAEIVYLPVCHCLLTLSVSAIGWPIMSVDMSLDSVEITRPQDSLALVNNLCDSLCDPRVELFSFCRVLEVLS